MWWVYILQSLTSGRYYTGSTERLEGRVDEHNSGQTVSTRGKGPWVLVYKEPYSSRSEAYARERQIKAWKSHKAISELIEAQVEHPDSSGGS